MRIATCANKLQDTQLEIDTSLTLNQKQKNAWYSSCQCNYFASPPELTQATKTSLSS